MSELQALFKAVGMRLPENIQTPLQGRQATTVVAGDVVLKLYKGTRLDNKTRGLGTPANERLALMAYGGMQGEHISIPALLSHVDLLARVDSQPLEYSHMLIQERMLGKPLCLLAKLKERPLPEIISEMHAHFNRNSIGPCKQIIPIARVNILLGLQSNGSILPKKTRQLVETRCNKFIHKRNGMIRVHGDFHLGNILYDGNKYSVVDLSNVGMSFPEQDFLLVGHDLNNRKRLFDGYEQLTGKRLSEDRFKVLQTLDLAIAAENAWQSGRQEQANQHIVALEQALR